MVKTDRSIDFTMALTNLIQVIDDDVTQVDFDYENEKVIVHYTLGGKVTVNVRGDSDSAVVKDVFKKIF